MWEQNKINKFNNINTNTNSNNSVGLCYYTPTFESVLSRSPTYYQDKGPGWVVSQSSYVRHMVVLF